MKHTLSALTLITVLVFSFATCKKVIVSNQPIADSTAQMRDNNMRRKNPVLIAKAPVGLYLSSYGYDLQAAIYDAQIKKMAVVIDCNITPPAFTIDGDITIIGANHPTVTNNNAVLFTLGVGNHYFEGFDIQQASGAIAFKSVAAYNFKWNNHLNAVNITGGSVAYWSDRGGDNSYTDTTTIENCTFKVARNGVVVYSQDGPYKALHMANVSISTDSSHNMYVHPNVSLRLNGVHSVHVGGVISYGSVKNNSPGLALHHFSGGGVAGKAQYVELTNCTTEKEGGMWQIAEPQARYVMMDSCSLALYSIPRPLTYARVCHFFNGGQGAIFKGTAVNCSGIIWPVDGSLIDGGQFDYLSLRPGGKTTIKNTAIKYVSGINTVSPYYATFENSRIEGMNLTTPYGHIILKHSVITRQAHAVPAGVITVQ